MNLHIRIDGKLEEKWKASKRNQINEEGDTHDHDLVADIGLP